MNTRLRFLGALLALFALSAYFAESVWAATCTPGMEVEMAMQHEGASQDHVGMQHSAPDSPDRSDHSRPDAPACPLAFGAGSTCVAVSLPAASTSVQLAALAAGAVTISPGAARDILLASTLFHPPRA